LFFRIFIPQHHFVRLNKVVLGSFHFSLYFNKKSW